MLKIIKSDIIVVIIIISGWLYYLIFDGPTRFDVNQTITLPLFLAIWFTALGALYVAGRYYKQDKQITEKLSGLVGEDQIVQPEDKIGADNKPQDTH